MHDLPFRVAGIGLQMNKTDNFCDTDKPYMFVHGIAEYQVHLSIFPPCLYNGTVMYSSFFCFHFTLEIPLSGTFIFLW